MEIKGAPLFQSNCWCSSCTAYHQVTPVPTAMWKADQISITKGADQLKRFTVRTPEMGRYFCMVRHSCTFILMLRWPCILRCGGHHGASLAHLPIYRACCRPRSMHRPAML
jgi:hypothetical protein